jgi:hypothetical protein
LDHNFSLMKVGLMSITHRWYLSHPQSQDLVLVPLLPSCHGLSVHLTRLNEQGLLRLLARRLQHQAGFVRDGAMRCSKEPEDERYKNCCKKSFVHDCKPELDPAIYRW